MKDFVEHLGEQWTFWNSPKACKIKAANPTCAFCLQVIEDLERECHSLELRHGHAREEVPLPCGFMNRFNLDNQWSGSKRVLYCWIFLVPKWSASACSISCSRQKKLLDLGFELFFPVSHFWRILATCFEPPRIKANVDTRVLFPRIESWAKKIHPGRKRIRRPWPPTSPWSCKSLGLESPVLVTGVTGVRIPQSSGVPPIGVWSQRFFDVFWPNVGKSLSSFKMEGPLRISRIHLFSADVKLYIL